MNTQNSPEPELVGHTADLEKQFLELESRLAKVKAYKYLASWAVDNLDSAATGLKKALGKDAVVLVNIAKETSEFLFSRAKALETGGLIIPENILAHEDAKILRQLIQAFKTKGR